MKNFDVLVAGAGVAGSLAARDMARAGLSVALIEKTNAENIGHDWWDTIESSIFNEIGLAPSQPPERMNGYNFTLLHPNGTTGITASMSSTHLNVDRKLFDRRLLEAAIDSGAELIDRASVVGPIIENGAVVGARVATNNSGNEYFRARVCMDATGVAASLRSKMPSGLGFKPRLDSRDYVAAWREIRRDTSNGGRTILFIGDENGAKWVSRDQPGLVEIFACSMNVPGRKEPKDIASELVRAEGGAGEELLRGGYGALIPVRRAFDSFVAPGLMLVGDSACMPNPINGSGITSGLRAAKIAAATAVRALNSGNFDTAALWSYNYEYKRIQDALFVKLYMLQQFILNQPKDNIHAFFKAGLISPDRFWELEKSLNPSENIDKVHKLARLLDRPAFLAGTMALMGLMFLMEEHYKQFPAEYDARAFKAWRQKTSLIMSLIPSMK